MMTWSVLMYKPYTHIRLAEGGSMAGVPLPVADPATMIKNAAYTSQSSLSPKSKPNTLHPQPFLLSMPKGIVSLCM